MQKEAKTNKKKPIVYKDESYLENISLITGAVINFDRILSTELQIRTLCIDARMSREQKFLYILNEDNKMAKWSIFQNIPFYIESTGTATSIFEALNKHFSQLHQELLAILGEGLCKFFSTTKIQLSQKGQNCMENMFERIMTATSPQLAEEWNSAFELYYVKYERPIEFYVSFVNGSFSMNASPERRQTAFIIVKGLLNHPSLPLKEIKTKVLFFNRDQNFKTRQIICRIAQKILALEPKEEEIWKVIWEYFDDTDPQVAKIAIETICLSKQQANFSQLTSELDNEKKSSLFLNQMQSFLNTFGEFYKRQDKQQFQKIKLIGFLNRIIKSENQEHIIQLFNNYTAVRQAIPQSELRIQLGIDQLNISKKRILGAIISVYDHLQNIELKDKIKSMIVKGIKFNNFQFFDKTKQLAQCFELKNEEDINLFLGLCNKMLDSYKWHSLEALLPYIEQLRMLQNVYEKVSLFLLKLILGCPYFLIDSTIKGIHWVLLSNRRSLQFLITIREKLMNSKCWTHRRNYMLLYCYIKRHSSFEFQKLVPVLIYKNLPNERAVGIKFEFLKVIIQTYKSVDPGTEQKQSIRDTVNRLTDDKDLKVAKEARETEIALMKIQQDHQIIHDAYGRNKKLIEQERGMNQVQQGSKKIIKIEKDLRRSLKKADTKTTINLTKQYAKKQVKLSPKSCNRTLNTQPKPTIFRHNSQKVKTLLPNSRNKL